MKAPEIALPANGWEPRHYQQPIWDYLDDGGKRAVAVWHRRAGKDALCLNWAGVSAHRRVGSYWHLLPEYAQARKALWTAVNPHTGRNIIDEAFPKGIRKRTRDQEMFIEFNCGSTWQLLGSDKYDSLVGSPPVGVVFSEWALADPRAWDYVRPILAENGGWALFIYTPRGRNHGLRLLEHARRDPAWFNQVLPAQLTGALSSDVLDGERRELIALWGEEEGERLFDQEYGCSFETPIRGAYYGKVLARLEASNHMRAVPYDPRYPVITGWDLGIGDSTAIWFVQLIAAEVRVIDFYQSSGQGLDHYAKVLKGKPYAYQEHFLPHDGGARELGTGKTREETLKMLQVGRVQVLPRQDVDDGINAVRNLLPSCYFDMDACAAGLDALRSYRSDYDESARVLKRTPVHDWCSHPADAFRYLAEGLRGSLPLDHKGRVVSARTLRPRRAAGVPIN